MEMGSSGMVVVVGGGVDEGVSGISKVCGLL